MKGTEQLTIGAILMDQKYPKIISALIFMQKHEARRQFNLICLPNIYCQLKIYRCFILHIFSLDDDNVGRLYGRRLFIFFQISSQPKTAISTSQKFRGSTPFLAHKKRSQPPRIGLHIDESKQILGFLGQDGREG